MEDGLATYKYNRVLLKLSGEALMGQGQFGIDASVPQRIAEGIKPVWEDGVQIAIDPLDPPADPEAAFFDFLPRSPGQQKPEHIPHGRRLTVGQRLPLWGSGIGSAVAQKHSVENLVQAVDALPAVLVDGGVCLKLGADLILFCQEQTAHIYGIHGGHLMIAVVLLFYTIFPLLTIIYTVFINLW